MFYGWGVGVGFIVSVVVFDVINIVGIIISSDENFVFDFLFSCIY